jgi:hypothetical protein
MDEQNTISLRLETCTQYRSQRSRSCQDLCSFFHSTNNFPRPSPSALSWVRCLLYIIWFLSGGTPCFGSTPFFSLAIHIFGPFGTAYTVTGQTGHRLNSFLISFLRGGITVYTNTVGTIYRVSGHSSPPFSLLYEQYLRLQVCSKRTRAGKLMKQHVEGVYCKYRRWTRIQIFEELPYLV